VIRDYGRDADDDLITGVNITPIVDVALTLLIVFIVSASFILSRSIPVELPRAATGAESAVGLLAIAVTRGGDVYLNGQPALLEDIPGAVAAARARLQPGQAIAGFISADVQAPYGRFAEVVDRLRLEGVLEIAIDTKPVEEAPRR